MIVDDSVVIRRLLTEALSADPDVDVVATAANGQLALGKLDSARPDVIVLDVEMPVLDGLGTLREIRKLDRRLPIIMFSTLTERGARITIEALASGASDYVTKPANVGSINESREAVRTQLLPRVRALAGAPATNRGEPARPPMARPSSAPAAAATARVPVAAVPATGGVPRLLAIGSSTGGPEALSRFLPMLPATLPVPVVITQHMPPVFTTMLADRLDRGCALAVREAVDGEPLQPGSVYLAPGDFHLEVRVEQRTRYYAALTKAPPENFCRPSVDVLFRSAVQAYGGGVLGVVLTGMGSDGRDGSRLIVGAGGQVLAQDEQSSVVWGMPGAV
ncbi:MAG TPA: chemotaxis response regulator protein-glutamate methylesterase, partial [Jatrophihabitans sp.]|nr:chemotaxis response regulator protein-glutamate methylesterase [Jatrophihabitans sp.]